MNRAPLEAKDRIIVALDVPSIESVTTLVEELAPYVGAFKIGLQLINRSRGHEAAEFIHSVGGRVFWDGKFKDIPNTVTEAAIAVAELGVWAFNVHCDGGIPMMEAAVLNRGQCLVLGVTVLTSLNGSQVRHIYSRATEEMVMQLAFDAQVAGLDGVICSPQELAYLQHLENLHKITPGVRPLWASTDDQARVMTPGEAVVAGADFLVIGRPITKPPKEIGTPVDAIKRIIEEIELAEVPNEF